MFCGKTPILSILKNSAKRGSSRFVNTNCNEARKSDTNYIASLPLGEGALNLVQELVAARVVEQE